MFLSVNMEPNYYTCTRMIEGPEAHIFFVYNSFTSMYFTYKKTVLKKEMIFHIVYYTSSCISSRISGLDQKRFATN